MFTATRLRRAGVPSFPSLAFLMGSVEAEEARGLVKKRRTEEAEPASPLSQEALWRSQPPAHGLSISPGQVCVSALLFPSVSLSELRSDHEAHEKTDGAAGETEAG